jgi:hypothetical protein
MTWRLQKALQSKLWCNKLSRGGSNGITTEDTKADTAQESPEARKVRRAKVVAAYAQLSDPAQETTTSAADSGVQLDTKA